MKRVMFTPGYTIVEVMIFLTITGVLLSSAMLVFNGRQRRTQFVQGSQQIEADLTTTINEVQTGYYPNENNFVCSGTGGSLSVSSAQTQNNQGMNEGCIFLGKAVRFSDTDKYSVYTLLGLQRTGGASGREVTTFSEAKPQALARFINDDTDVPDVTEVKTLPAGLRVTKVVDSSGNSVGGFAIILSMGKYVDTSVATAGQSVDLFSLPNTAPDAFSATSDARFKTALNQLSETNRTGKVIICMTNDERKAALTVDDIDSQLTVTAVVDSVPVECGG